MDHLDQLVNQVEMVLMELMVRLENWGHQDLLLEKPQTCMVRSENNVHVTPPKVPLADLVQMEILDFPEMTATLVM